MPPLHNSGLHLDLKGGHDIHAPYDALSAICATDLPPWLSRHLRLICILPKRTQHAAIELAKPCGFQ